MEFKNRKREHKANYDEENKKLAQDFVKELKHELKDFLKAAVMFGSSAREKREEIKKTDIDVLLIIDDADIIITPELTQTYQLIVKNVGAKISPRLHISTLRLTSFWEKVKEGDPVVINILRDGVALHDKGIFKPVQVLLDQGRVRPTREAIWTYYARSPVSIQNSRKHVMQACVDLYWAGIDAAHAALMAVGAMPPSPEHVPEYMQTHLVDMGKLPRRYPTMMRELYDLSKHIEHRDIKSVTGRQYDAYLKETKDLIEHLRQIVKDHSE